MPNFIATKRAHPPMQPTRILQHHRWTRFLEHNVGSIEIVNESGQLERVRWLPLLRAVIEAHGLSFVTRCTSASLRSVTICEMKAKRNSWQKCVGAYFAGSERCCACLMSLWPAVTRLPIR